MEDGPACGKPMRIKPHQTARRVRSTCGTRTLVISPIAHNRNHSHLASRSVMTNYKIDRVPVGLLLSGGIRMRPQHLGSPVSPISAHFSPFQGSYVHVAGRLQRLPDVPRCRILLYDLWTLSRNEGLSAISRASLSAIARASAPSHGPQPGANALNQESGGSCDPPNRASVIYLLVNAQQRVFNATLPLDLRPCCMSPERPF